MGRKHQLLHPVGRFSLLCSEESLLNRLLLLFLANVGLLSYGLNRTLWTSVDTPVITLYHMVFMGNGIPGPNQVTGKQGL